MFTCNFFSYNMFLRFIHVAWTRTSLWTTQPDFHPDLPRSVDGHLPLALGGSDNVDVHSQLLDADCSAECPFGRDCSPCDLVRLTGPLGSRPSSNDSSIFSSTVVRWNPGRVSRLPTKWHCDLAAVCGLCHCPPFFVSTGPQSYFRPLCGRPGPGCWTLLPSLKTRRSSLGL